MIQHLDILDRSLLMANSNWAIYLGRIKEAVAKPCISRTRCFELAFREMKIMPVGSRVQTQ